MAYTITPMTAHTGAEVRGLDLTTPIDAETRGALNRAFSDHHVLVIRDQKFGPPQFIAAAELFGELQPHDKKELHVPGYPQMYFVSNEQTVPGKRYISGETFHTDHSNSSGAAQGDDAVSGLAAEHRRRHPVRQYA